MPGGRRPSGRSGWGARCWRSRPCGMRATGRGPVSPPGARCRRGRCPRRERGSWSSHFSGRARPRGCPADSKYITPLLPGVAGAGHAIAAPAGQRSACRMEDEGAGRKGESVRECYARIQAGAAICANEQAVHQGLPNHRAVEYGIGQNGSAAMLVRILSSAF